jgi:hypothetical protein
MSRGGHVNQAGRGGAARGTGRDESRRPVKDAMFMLRRVGGGRVDGCDVV